MSIKPQIELEETEEAEWWLSEDMPESQPHIDLSGYAKQVLAQQYVVQGWFITGNLAIFPPHNGYAFRYLAPDVVLFKGTILSPTERANLSRWQMSRADRPAPTVVLEISSKETWQQDLDPKPTYYQQLGVREYFACDPQGFWTGSSRRVRGWRYVNGTTQPIEPDSRGWLWSEELESWLGWDGVYLRFYDRQGTMRLTIEEAALQQAQAEQTAKEAALQQAQAEQTAKEAALQQAQAEHAILQALLEKLRKNNIDPDTL